MRERERGRERERERERVSERKAGAESQNERKRNSFSFEYVERSANISAFKKIREKKGFTRGHGKRSACGCSLTTVKVAAASRVSSFLSFFIHTHTHTHTHTHARTLCVTV